MQAPWLGLRLQGATKRVVGPSSWTVNYGPEAAWGFEGPELKEGGWGGGGECPCVVGQ